MREGKSFARKPTPMVIGERVEQLEDQNYRGKISARYLFKAGQVVGQEQVADGEPPSVVSPFVSVEEQFKSMASNVLFASGDNRALAGKKGIGSATEIK
jgi:hypothetical protein